MTQAANNSYQKHKYTFNICKLSIYTTVMFILKKTKHMKCQKNTTIHKYFKKNHISPLLVLGSSLDFPIFSEPFHCNFSVSNGSK